MINRRVPLWETSDEQFSRVIDTNLMGVVNVIRHFAPAMSGQGRGVIVNLSSRWATASEGRMAPYCAAKSAVAAVTRALAEELRPTSVAAIALNPGVVDTDMLRAYLEEQCSEALTCPSPADWARVACPFLLGLGFKDTGKLRNLLGRPKRRARTEAGT